MACVSGTHRDAVGAFFALDLHDLGHLESEAPEQHYASQHLAVPHDLKASERGTESRRENCAQRSQGMYAAGLLPGKKAGTVPRDSVTLHEHCRTFGQRVAAADSRGRVRVHAGCQIDPHSQPGPPEAHLKTPRVRHRRCAIASASIRGRISIMLELGNLSR